MRASEKRLKEITDEIKELNDRNELTPELDKKFKNRVTNIIFYMIDSDKEPGTAKQSFSVDASLFKRKTFLTIP